MPINDEPGRIPLSRKRRPQRASLWVAAAGFLLAILAALVPSGRSDEPLARSRQYDLQNARVELRFDFDQRKVSGQVTHTLTALHDGLRQIEFDSVGLTISSVRVNGRNAQYSTDAAKLRVDLESPAKAGSSYQIAIRYQGQPEKGLYFVAPDRSYPNQTKQIWTQGQAEETRYYIPIYDYPNDRTTTEMILTVPDDWVTVSNGRLISVTDAAGEMKTWTWRQSQPISTYLISLVAGEFDQVREMWRGMPVDYYVPRGKRERIAPTFSRTRDMLTFFSERFGLPYPWEKYAQTMVDQFVVGGMENVSAATLTTRGMLHPELAEESLKGSDGLISHELGHQWFGNLVTCKDWANLWLNEGFATLAANLWEEHAFGADNAAYSRWRSQAAWLRRRRSYSVPIVTHDFNDSLENQGNIYGKAGLVLHMLRQQLGEEAFFRGLQHYLEANRLGNVVTADLAKALEESTHTNVDRFFDQWIYGAGAPRFVVAAAYDSRTKKVSLTVKQTQKVEGRVGLFDVPLEVAITTPSGTEEHGIRVSKVEETFSFPADAEPLLVLFDKGNHILKAVEFEKSTTQWIHQLQRVASVPDRADAAVALGTVKGKSAAVVALGKAALGDRFWGVRVEALRALKRIGSREAQQWILQSLANPEANPEPWVREVAVEQLGSFRDHRSLPARLMEISRNDAAYRVRAAALSSLAQMKAPGARETLEAAVLMGSPDEVIRRAALRAMGRLGDEKTGSTLLEWSVQGKPINLRTAAIRSLGRIDKKNTGIRSRLISYLDDPNYDIRFATLFALGDRGDRAAIAPLEAMLDRPDVTRHLTTLIKRQIERLKRARSAATAAAAGPSA